MSENKGVFNIIIINMAKQLKVELGQDGGIYRLYKNKQKQVHREHYFEGNSEETYRKLVLIEKYKSGGKICLKIYC